MSAHLSLKDKNTIADLHTALKDISVKYPIIMDFLEYYCGYNTPVASSDPYKISYSGGKRDVILMIKTLMRDDILPENVAQYYERNL